MFCSVIYWRSWAALFWWLTIDGAYSIVIGQEHYSTNTFLLLRLKCWSQLNYSSTTVSKFMNSWNHDIRTLILQNGTRAFWLEVFLKFSQHFLEFFRNVLKFHQIFRERNLNLRKCFLEKYFRKRFSSKQTLKHENFCLLAVSIVPPINNVIRRMTWCEKTVTLFRRCCNVACNPIWYFIDKFEYLTVLTIFVVPKFRKDMFECFISRKLNVVIRYIALRTIR